MPYENGSFRFKAVAAVERALGARSFECCWRLGRSLGAEEVVDYALGEWGLTALDFERT